MATSVRVRQYLRDKGIKDEDIGFRGDDGTVTVGGNPFLYGITPNAEGKAMAGQSNLDQAFNNYQSRNYRNQAIGRLTKPIEPFKLNMRDIERDPTYKAALGTARENTQIAEGDISAAMNRRGIMDSTITANAASGAAQREYGRVSRDVLPGLIQDYYKRYIDSQNAERQQTGDIMGVADYYSGEADKIGEAQATDRAARIKYAQDLRKDFGVDVPVTEEYGLMDKAVEGMNTLDSQKELEKAMQNQFKNSLDASDKLGVVTQTLSQLIGVPAGTPMLEAQKAIQQAAYQMGMLGVSQQNAQTSAGNAENRSLDKGPSNSDVNSFVSQMRQLYTKKDAGTGATVLTDESALRQAVISKYYKEDGSNDNLIDQVLSTFGLQPN